MECIKQQLQHLPGFRRLGALVEPTLERGKGRGNVPPQDGDLFPEFGKRRPHARHRCVHIYETGAETDEIGVIAVEVVDEIHVERREVDPQLGAQALERDKAPEIGDVGLRIEILL